MLINIGKRGLIVIRAGFVEIQQAIGHEVAGLVGVLGDRIRVPGQSRSPLYVMLSIMELILLVILFCISPPAAISVLVGAFAFGAIRSLLR